MFHVKRDSCGNIVSSFRPVVFVLDDVGEMKQDVYESGEISQHQR